MGFGRLSPLNKALTPQNEIGNTINQWSFCQFAECQPPGQTQSPSIENFLVTVLSGPFIQTFVRLFRVTSSTGFIAWF